MLTSQNGTRVPRPVLPLASPPVISPNAAVLSSPLSCCLRSVSQVGSRKRHSSGDEDMMSHMAVGQGTRPDTRARPPPGGRPNDQRSMVDRGLVRCHPSPHGVGSWHPHGSPSKMTRVYTKCQPTMVCRDPRPGSQKPMDCHGTRHQRRDECFETKRDRSRSTLLSALHA